MPLPIPSAPSRNMLKPQQFNKIYFIWSISVNDQRYKSTEVSPIRGIELEYRSLKEEIDYNNKNFWILLPYLLSTDIDNLILPKLV